MVEVDSKWPSPNIHVKYNNMRRSSKFSMRSKEVIKVEIRQRRSSPMMLCGSVTEGIHPWVLIEGGRDLLEAGEVGVPGSLRDCLHDLVDLDP